LSAELDAGSMIPTVRRCNVFSDCSHHILVEEGRTIIDEETVINDAPPKLYQTNELHQFYEINDLAIGLNLSC
jgi:hypothetical protein